MALLDLPSERATGLAEASQSVSAELAAMAASKDVKNRVAAAAHPETPLTTLIVLAQDGKEKVRVALAANRGIGRALSVVAMLADDKSSDVQLELVRNPAVAEDTVRDLAQRGKKAVRRAAEERLAS